MLQFEIAMYTVDLTQWPDTDLSAILEQKHKDTGAIMWDEMRDWANDGWEPVSVTPLNRNGSTIMLLYTFKRLIEDVGYD